MIYPILRRIFRRHAKFHLLIPLGVGVIVEAVYSLLAGTVTWSTLRGHLLSGDRIALYAGIVCAYVLVIGILVKSETSIGIRRLELNTLAEKLHDATSIMAVGTLTFEEWFEPAVQVYFTTLLEPKMAMTSLRYERVLLLPSRSALNDLNSDYLDGYHAKCLIDIHRRLGIKLSFLEWIDIRAILSALDVPAKIHIGLYPRLMRRVPSRLARSLMAPFERRQVRNVACVIIETSNGSKFAVRFTKRHKVVTLQFEPEPECLTAYMTLVELIEQALETKENADFTKYY